MFGILLAAAMLAVLSGCSDWERQPPIFQEEQQKTEQEAQGQPVFLPQAEKEGQEEPAPEEQPAVLAEALSVVSTTNSENTWKTQDEVLAQSVYDAFQIKHEEYETLDIRPYDFDVVFTDADGNEITYGMWINFERDNNVIVRDSEGKLWDIPVYDSNRLRIILEALS